jgi:hypothetical protein
MPTFNYVYGWELSTGNVIVMIGTYLPEGYYDLALFKAEDLPQVIYERYLDLRSGMERWA